MISRERIEKIIIFILIILYIEMLKYAYPNIAIQYWGYFFPFQERNGVPDVVSWILVLFPLFFLDFKKKTLSNYVVGFLYLFNYIPGCVLMEYVTDRIQYWYLFFGYWLFLFILNKVFPYSKKVIATGQVGYKFNKIMVVFFVCVIIVIWLGYADARMYLSLDDIYVARMEARKYQMPMVLSYCFSFATALVPIGIIVGLCKRKWKASILLTVVGLMVYLITGSKSALFSVLLVWGIWGVRHIITEDKIWLYVIFALNMLGMIAIVTRISILRISSYFFQRMLFLPARINVSYYDYFKNAEKDYFRQSIVGKLTGLSSPYKVDIPRLIGKYTFNNIETNANTGVVGDAYANLGVIGIVVMPILIIVLLRMIDICIKGLDFKIYLFLGVILALFLLSVSFFTMFLSNGVLIILVYFLSVKRQRGISFPVDKIQNWKKS